MVNLHKAIRAIYNSVVSINGNTQETIVATDKDGNEVSINWSLVNEQLPTVEAEIEQEKQDAINKKASGKQKLLELGLTEEEVKALIGI